MTQHAQRTDECPPINGSPDGSYTARAKAARSGEQVSRWLLAASIIAAAAIFWTLAADAFTSV